MTTDPVHTWILNDDHSIVTWYESTPGGTMYKARCKCGWYVSSTNGGTRNHLADGHAQDALGRPVR